MQTFTISLMVEVGGGETHRLPVGDSHPLNPQSHPSSIKVLSRLQPVHNSSCPYLTHSGNFTLIWSPNRSNPVSVTVIREMLMTSIIDKGRKVRHITSSDWVYLYTNRLLYSNSSLFIPAMIQRGVPSIAQSYEVLGAKRQSNQIDAAYTC